MTEGFETRRSESSVDREGIFVPGDQKLITFVDLPIRRHGSEHSISRSGARIAGFAILRAFGRFEGFARFTTFAGLDAFVFFRSFNAMSAPPN